LHEEVAVQPASQEGQEERVGCGLQGPLLYVENPHTVGAAGARNINKIKKDTIQLNKSVQRQLHKKIKIIMQYTQKIETSK
jgi:hypothetical protein